MDMQLQPIATDPDVVAITMRRTLAPLDGPDVPVFPATYPAPEKGKHRLDSPYTINELRDGRLVADLDSVQSQANRMEAAFSGPFAQLVPQHAIEAGGRRASLVELPHRLADAVARASDLRDAIHAAMEDYAAGKPSKVAKLCPTALVYGAWDSRDTQVKIPRAVRAEIRAHDVSVATRSAQFTGTFDAETLGLTEDEWKKGADVGFAPTPSVNAHGGVYVHGEILHTASIVLAPLRRGGDDQLTSYLLGLAVVGLLHAMRETRLRVGCELIPLAPPQWESIQADGTRTRLDVLAKDVERTVADVAETWAREAGVVLGEEATVHLYDPKAAKAAIKAAGKGKGKAKSED
jgi:CRISPR-associated protein Csb1